MSTVAMLERELQDAVMEMARLFGWKCAHFRPARTEHGWRTSVQGDAGFPDLILVGGKAPNVGRCLAVELKSTTGMLRRDQIEWLSAFSETAVETFTWRPKDLHDGTIERTLRG